MSSIRIQITVEIDGSITDGNNPSRLTWNHRQHVGDNPRFYGDAVNKAIARAARKADIGTAVYIDLKYSADVVDPEGATTDNRPALRPERSDRGFAHMPIINGPLTGEQITVYESSAAFQARVWLHVVAPRDRNHPDGCDLNEAVIELDLYAVRDLRDQLDWMLANHYQTKPTEDADA
jgi:hypothetical protein